MEVVSLELERKQIVLAEHLKGQGSRARDRSEFSGHIR